jgi:O-antigen ligase
MKTEKVSIAFNENSQVLPAFTAGIVTTATFAKQFVPFYLIGSTPIFASACLSGAVLTIISWREIRKNLVYANEILLALASLYGVILANYFTYSLGQVALTHLVGILLFHSLFLVFGFAAARALKVVYGVLLAQAAIYVIILAQYTFRFGDLMRDGFLQDVFGVGVPELVTTFHQNIGTALALALLSALGFRSSWIRISAIIALPLVLLFMFHIAARTALVSLFCSLVFLTWANLWVRSKKIALVAFLTLVMAAVVASGLFYSYALQDKDVDSVAPDAVSRTIREIQSHNPGLRIEIWSRAWHRIAAHPDRLPFGHGIGAYSIDEGFGPPSWLLDRTTKHYPHNSYLELLYETGITGFSIFGLVTLFPVLVALKQWMSLSGPGRAGISLYVFYLSNIQISGSFTYSYDFQFFLALAVGVVCRKRKELAHKNALSLAYTGSEASA